MPLPQNWYAATIGGNVAGSGASYTNGIFSLTYPVENNQYYFALNSTDSCEFAYQVFSSNYPCQITAELTTWPGGPFDTMAGVMMRSSLADNASGGTMSGIAPSPNSFLYGYRATTGGLAQNPGSLPTLSVPYWFRLSWDPVASTITGYYSPDGATWTQASSEVISGWAGSIYVGLAVNNSQNGNAALFSNVTVTGTVPTASINYSSTSGGFQYTAGTAGAIASVETSPGVYSLLIGSSNPNGTILERDSTYTTFTDNGTPYEAGLIVGNIVLAAPGELAELAFVTADFNGIGSKPALGVRIDEIGGDFSNISGYVVSDPPMLYGANGGPNTLYSNRYYLRQSIAGAIPPPAWMRHLAIIVDFGNLDQVMNEIFSLSLYGAILQEKS